MQNLDASLSAADPCPGPDVYYYKVVECGRRLLLTGGLIFIAPNSSTQVAAACVFAFGSLLGFELFRPHLNRAHAWLYRAVSQPTILILCVFVRLLICEMREGM